LTEFAPPRQLNRYVLSLLHSITSMTRNRKLLVVLLAIPALVIILVPWNTTVVPAVRVQVFDETGNRAAGVRVEQEWGYTALESYSQRAVSVTDSNGYVSFPKRSLRISLARKTIGFVANMFPAICAIGFGPSGSISAYGADSRANDIVVCDINNPTPRALKLTRWDLVAH
jgi:hypothetical protein